MCDTAKSTSEAVKRIISGDSTLKVIELYNQQYTDEDIAELVDCLLAHPDVITHVNLTRNMLTAENGVKLARYAAISSTLKAMSLVDNQIGNATYLALAAALRVNTSLGCLLLLGNQTISIEDKSIIDMAFMDALILNPNRPDGSVWCLYSWDHNDFDRLKRMSEELGHPNMQAILAMI